MSPASVMLGFETLLAHMKTYYWISIYPFGTV